LLWIGLALALFVVLVGFILFREAGRPPKAVAWIAIQFLFPYVGFIAYLLLGKDYMGNMYASAEEERKWAMIRGKLADRGRSLAAADETEAFPDARLGASLRSLTPFPVSHANNVKVFTEGQAAFEDMFSAIAAARHHIHAEFYIIRNDELGNEFMRLLAQKAGEGVKVRLLYDGIGCLRFRQTWLERLPGVETACFFPPVFALFRGAINFRNHRKIVVVDGKVGFFGGLNIGDEYVGKHPKLGFWRDTHFRLEGDAVRWIQYTFLTDWHFITGRLIAGDEYYPEPDRAGAERVQIVKSGPDRPMLDLLFACMAAAKRRIYVETPYFIPDPAIRLALTTAAKSGIDVRIIVPSRPDHRFVHRASLSYAAELARAGVRFYAYNKGFIHSKVVIVDDLACSGSANMDIRSFSGQFELNAVFYDRPTVERLIVDFFTDLRDSSELTADMLERRTFGQRIGERVARLVSPML
jgi:cardiolipin synthase